MQRSITSHLVAVNQRLMSPYFDDLAEWLCKAFWQLGGMVITNDLPSVFCWVSQMASSHISSSIRWDEIWIFYELF
jgi:hypothetical protein